MTESTLADIQCSFCGVGRYQAFTFIAGPNDVYIWDVCVEICRDILGAARSQRDGKSQALTPLVPRRPRARKTPSSDPA